jgi:hypothetical protein
MPSPPPKRRRGPFHPLTMRPNAVHGLLGPGAPIPQQTMPAGPRNIMHDIGLPPIASPSVDPADAIRQAPPPPLVGQQPDAHPFQPFDSITPSHVLGLGTTSFYSVKYIPQAQQELIAIAVVDCIEQIRRPQPRPRAQSFANLTGPFHAPPARLANKPRPRYRAPHSAMGGRELRAAHR